MFETMGDIIEAAEFDLDEHTERIARINGAPAYVWQTNRPIRFIAVPPHAAGPAWHTVRYLEVSARRAYGRTRMHPISRWEQVECIQQGGYTVWAYARNSYNKPVHIEPVAPGSLSDAEYDALTNAVQELQTLIQRSKQLDQDFEPDGLEGVDWNKLQATHQALLDTDDKMAFTKDASFVISSRQAASRKNMYSGNGHDAEWETDPAVQWHAEAQRLAKAEHVAEHAYEDAKHQHMATEWQKQQLGQHASRARAYRNATADTFEQARNAFRLAGWPEEEKGHDMPRTPEALEMAGPPRPWIPRLDEDAEQALKRNVAPVYKTKAGGALWVLPISEQAKPPRQRRWYPLTPEQKVRYDARARQALADLNLPDPPPLTPAKVKHKALDYTTISTRHAHSIRAAAWLMEDLGALDPTMSFKDFDAHKLEAAERVIRDEVESARDRRTAVDKALEPIWTPGLKAAPLPNIQP